MKKTQGFTLIELSLFMGLFMIIIGVLMTLFSSIVQKQLEVQSVSAVEADSKFILSRLAYDIQRSDAIVVPNSLGDTTTSLVLSIDSDTYTYDLSGGTIQLTTNTGTSVLNSIRSTVSNISFKRLGNTAGTHAIELTYTVTSTVTRTQGPETKTMQTVIGTR